MAVTWSTSTIVRGEDAAKHFGKGHGASYLTGGKIAFIRDDATVSEVLEEMHHAEQDRTGMFSGYPAGEMYLRREIEAQNYLLAQTEKYKIPDEEVEQTKRNLEQYEEELRKYQGQVG